MSALKALALVAARLLIVPFVAAKALYDGATFNLGKLVRKLDSEKQPPQI